MMSRIRGRDTAPELAVRQYLHATGLRYRANCRSLPGTPDIALRRFRTAIFVHGCFWHRHKGCRFTTTPVTRGDFWQEKFVGNVLRDRRNADRLRSMGWRVLTVWECQVHSAQALDRLFWRIVAGG